MNTCGLTVSRTLAWGAIFALLSVFPAAHAEAQDLTAAAISVARIDVNGTNAIASPQSQVHLEAREEGGAVSALFGLAFGQDQRASLSLQLTGPFEKGTEERELANLNDLPGGVEGKLRFSYAFSREREGSSESLTLLCREVNDKLRARISRLDDAALTLLREALALEGEDRYDKLLEFWIEFGDARDRRLEELEVKVKGKTATPDEKREYTALTARIPPTREELEAAAVAPLCVAWNQGRLEKLLIDPFSGTAGRISHPASAGACDLPSLIRVREDEAAAKATDEASEALAKARKQAELEEEQARIEADTLLAAAEGQAREVVASAEPSKQAIARANAEAALVAARIRHAEHLAATHLRKERAIAAAEVTAAAAVETAREKEKEAIYEEAAKSLRQGIDAWNGADIPFLRARPGEVAEIACDDAEILGLLSSLDKADRRSVYRGLLRALPSQGFFTVEYGNSSQDFKFLATPLQVDPDTQLLLTKSTNEHNQSGRVGFSLFRQGWLWTIGGTEKSEWKAAKAGQFCVPLGTEGNQSCASASPGPPVDTASRLYDLQFKGQLSPVFAILGQLFYKEEGSVLNPHLLLYFLPEKDRLRGGVDISYTLGSSKKEENGYQARLFIGMPFSMAP